MPRKPVAFVYNDGALQAIRQLAKSRQLVNETAEKIRDEAQRLADAASPENAPVNGFYTQPQDQRTRRAGAGVLAAGPARGVDSRHNILLKAIKAGRL